MAWGVPQTWVTGQIVTAADLNQDIRDNIGHLAGMKAGNTALSALSAASELIRGVQTQIASITSDVAMSSSTYAVVTGLSLSVTPNSANFVLALFNCQHNQAGGGTGDVRLFRSAGTGGTFTNLASPATASGATENYTLYALLTGHSVGVAQTIRAEQHTDGTGTSTVKRGQLILIAL